MEERKRKKEKKQRLPILRLSNLKTLSDLLTEVCGDYKLPINDHPFFLYWQEMLKKTPDVPVQVFKMMSHPIATFSLLAGKDQHCTIHVPPKAGNYIRDVAERVLIKPDFLQDNLEQMSCSRAGACKLSGSKWTDSNTSTEAKECMVLRAKQFQARITIKPRNLCTLFQGKWLDSAVLDAWLHGLHRSFREADKLYIISAEEDPNLDILKSTHGCFDYILQVLHRKGHWTCMFINHRCREIFYYNSQISGKTAKKQLRPYRRKFKDYAIEVAQVPQQSDNFSCGVFVCWYAYCTLFCPELIQSLRGEKSREMREAILRQLLVWYVL